VAAVAAASRSQHAQLAAAASGDQDAFAALARAHGRSLHLHCYRLLGSLHDADDALQETWLRAWRNLDRYEPRAPLSAWLHGIATNVCLTALSRRRRRREQLAAGPGAEVWEELSHVQPYPDRLLDELDGPEARFAAREQLELAFVTALQLLPPKQRAVLVMRDVLEWSARETAAALDDSVAAVNSALQRARARLERARPLAAPPHEGADAPSQRRLLRQFMEAWDAVDLDGLARLLAADAVLTMPPFPSYYAGRAAVREFFATEPAGGQLERIRLVPTGANRQPALAAYYREAEGTQFRAYGVMVLALHHGAISGVVGFVGPALFGSFGLPAELATNT
jgi:RNA polymerase sigma-70 factor (ECF subfamily)